MTGKNYRYETYQGIKVAWLPELDGGGRGIGQQNVYAVKKLFGRVDRIHEFCAGPGFIGFALLAEGLCNTLCLSDVNPLAIEAVNETIRINGLEDRVNVYLSDVLEGIPEDEKWDLVVANPPHQNMSQEGGRRLRAADPGWRLHKKFYACVRRFLKPNGSCLMWENYHGGNDENTFLPMLKGSGLRFVASFMVNEHFEFKQVNSVRYPRTTNFFFWTALDHPQILFANKSPATEVKVVISDVETARSDSLFLETGSKYEFKIQNDTQESVAIEFVDDEHGLCARHMIPPGISVLPIAIHTKPAKLRSVDRGHVFAEFNPKSVDQFEPNRQNTQVDEAN